MTTPGGAGRAQRLLGGAALAIAVQRALTARPPGGDDRWTRTNHRGSAVSLLSGPALAVSAAATGPAPVAACAVAGLGAAAFGAYDDVVGARPEQGRDKGLRGHAAALRRGRVSAGAVKVVGIGATGVVAARVASPERPVAEVLLDGVLVAAGANLVNLFDLRPGRALKVGLLSAAALDAPGPAGAAMALLPGDLRERTMLGDAGANALGAVLAVAALRRPRHWRLRALAAATALTAASEVVSYSRVIDAVPPLRLLDRLGRLP